MNATLNRWAPHALALLRIMTALLFIEHGTAKLLGFPASDMRPAFPTLPWIAGLMEIVGGGLVLVGFWTRATAFVLSGLMAVASFMAHAPSSFFPMLNGGDAAALFSFIFFYLVFAGPGAWSLDASRSRRR